MSRVCRVKLHVTSMLHPRDSRVVYCQATAYCQVAAAAAAAAEANRSRDVEEHDRSGNSWQCARATNPGRVETRGAEASARILSAGVRACVGSSVPPNDGLEKH